MSIDGKVESPEAILCKEQDGNTYAFRFDGHYFCISGYDCNRQRKYTGKKKFITAPICGKKEGYDVRRQS